MTACTAPNPDYYARQASTDASDPDAETVLDPDGAAAPTPDAPGAPDTPAGADAPPAADAPPMCGTARPDISGITHADGLAVGKDGTLYFTSGDGTNGWIGRLSPGEAPQSRWLRLDAAPIMTGLAYDGARDRLYVASVSSASIVMFETVTGTATSGVLINNLDAINDLTLDTAGNVYYSQQGDRHVYRVTPQGTATRVSATPIGDLTVGQVPAALAFAPDGALVVGLKNGGPIYRLVLASGQEKSRSTFGSFDGWANGLAFDAAGRLYVGRFSGDGAAHLDRLDSKGNNPVEVFTDGSYSSLVFGRGFLDCHDLYAAVPDGALRRLQTDTVGLSSP